MNLSPVTSISSLGASLSMDNYFQGVRVAAGVSSAFVFSINSDESEQSRELIGDSTASNESVGPAVSLSSEFTSMKSRLIGMISDSYNNSLSTGVKSYNLTSTTADSLSFGAYPNSSDDSADGDNVESAAFFAISGNGSSSSGNNSSMAVAELLSSHTLNISEDTSSQNDDISHEYLLGESSAEHEDSLSSALLSDSLSSFHAI